MYEEHMRKRIKHLPSVNLLFSANQIADILYANDKYIYD